MGYLEDLDLVNTSGNTKSLYSLIADLATAVGIVNDKVVVATPSATLALTPVDGTSYCYNTTSFAVNASLPKASLCKGMRLYFKNTAGTTGINVLRFSGDTIDGAASNLALDAVNDQTELISDGVSNWITKHKAIA
jgi:hypothetical protein